jgi:acetyltransferase-like isoleucine patch superfamily enzyme
MQEDPRLVQWQQLGARIGKDIYVGADVYVELDFVPLLTIEDGVVLARGVSILFHDSALNNIAGEAIKFAQVVLRKNCYIGANSTILCGVEVGVGALVGACSLVTKDIPPGAVAHGQPAQVMGTVQDLIVKQRLQQTASGKYGYLDVIPWRDRRDEAAHQQVAAQIGELMRRMIETTDSHSSK